MTILKDICLGITVIAILILAFLLLGFLLLELLGPIVVSLLNSVIYYYHCFTKFFQKNNFYKIYLEKCKGSRELILSDNKTGLRHWPIPIKIILPDKPMITEFKELFKNFSQRRIAIRKVWKPYKLIVEQSGNYGTREIENIVGDYEKDICYSLATRFFSGRMQETTIYKNKPGTSVIIFVRDSYCAKSHRLYLI